MLLHVRRGAFEQQALFSRVEEPAKERSGMPAFGTYRKNALMPTFLRLPLGALPGCLRTHPLIHTSPWPIR